MRIVVLDEKKTDHIGFFEIDNFVVIRFAYTLSTNTPVVPENFRIIFTTWAAGSYSVFEYDISEIF